VSREKLPDASTVILVRENPAGESPFEMFLMKRHRRQTFMGGAFVFPGGSLDNTDCDPRLASHARGITPEEAPIRLNEPDLPEDKALGLFYAALRETFEEAGVLLGEADSGEAIMQPDSEHASRFAEYRHQIHRGEISLGELAEREAVSYRLDLLTPYAHWITPEIEGKRFDTRFFLARIPDGQVPEHDAIEMTESLWISPAGALALQKRGELLLMPPTLKTVEELTAYSSIDELLTAAIQRTIRPILPQVFQTANCFGVKLPHDVEYTIEEYKQTPRSDEPSRIVMLDGRWRTMCADEFVIE